jgi:threonine dehydrogenase-like Zn-dependent dehydrogenase
VRAVVYEDVGRVAVADLPDPEVTEPDDAVIRVTVSAICGSDLHFFHGKAPLDRGEGIGHEAVGVVEQVGPAVERVRPGDRVAVSFVIACGSCWFCKAGQTQLCEDFRNLGAGILGGDLGGAQAELLRVPHADTNLLLLPDALDDERALFLGDILTTGVYGAEVADVRPGDTVAVVGAGPVGFFAIQAAVARGADRVLALDMLPDRLALAERAGAEAVDVSSQHPQMALAERTGDRGADVVIEAVGHPRPSSARSTWHAAAAPSWSWGCTRARRCRRRSGSGGPALSRSGSRASAPYTRGGSAPGGRAGRWIPLPSCRTAFRWRTRPSTSCSRRAGPGCSSCRDRRGSRMRTPGRTASPRWSAA